MSQHQFSMPKSTAPNQKHSKVTVTTKEDGSPLYNLEEILLSFGVEPKEVVSNFDNLRSADYLMKLDGMWDIITTMYNDFPDMYDGTEYHEMKLIRALLSKNLRPAQLCNPKDAGFVKHLNEMQDGWAALKETHTPAPPVCAFCGTVGAVLRCSGCMEIRKEVHYCNKECQLSGWKAHKKTGCGRYASEEAKAAVKKACEKKKGSGH